MKASKILKRALALLLGLIVYFSVASPMEAYAAPDADTDPWIITVPAVITAGTTNPDNDKVTISGTWEASKTVTVTSDTEIIMTCDTIPDSEVTAKVNFPADGLHTLSKHGAAETVEQTISVEAPDVLLGVWTGTINYEVTTNDFAPQEITILTQPAKTQYIEEQTFDPAGMQLKVVYLNGAEETIDVATNAAVTLPTAPLKYSDEIVTVGYGGNSYEVPVDVLPKLIALEATGYQNTYTEGDTFSDANLVVKAIYQQDGVAQEPTPVTGYTIGRDMTAPLLVSDSGNITITYVDADNQTATTDIAITVNPRLENIAVTGGDRSYIEGEPFNPTDISVDVTYTENGETKTKTVTYPDDRISIPDDGLTADDTTVTLTYTEYGQSVEQDVTVTVIPKLDSLVISGTYDDFYYENQTFDPTGMTVQAKYIRNGAEELVDISLDDPNLTLSPSTSDALTLTNNEVTITYVDADGQTVTAVIPITVEKKTLDTISITPDTFKDVYGEEDPAFDPTGMVLTKTYTDGSTETVTIQSADELTIGAYDFTLPDGAANNFVNIPISYTEDGVTRSATASVEVRYYPQMDPRESSYATEMLYGYLSSGITAIEIRDDGYVPDWTPDDSDYWAEAIATPVDGVGAANDIMLYADYVEGKITIVGNGSGKILLLENCDNLFYGGSDLTSITGLELLDTRNVRCAFSMFSRLRKMEYLKIPDTWDFSGVGDSDVGLTGMFGSFGERATAPVLDVSGMKVSGVRSLGAMFSKAGVSELDLSNWVLDDEASIVSMFESCPNLTTIYVSYDWNEKLVTGTSFFEGCTALVGGNGTVWSADAIGIDMLNIDRDGNPGYFTYKAPSN